MNDFAKALAKAKLEAGEEWIFELNATPEGAQIWVRNEILPEKFITFAIRTIPVGPGRLKCTVKILKLMKRA